MKQITDADIEKISNFGVEVNSVFDIKSFYGEHMSYQIELRIFNEYAEKSASVSWNELNKIDFEEIDPTFLLSAENKKKARNTVIQYIKEQAAGGIREEKILLDKLGWYRSEGKVCYNAGNRIIASDKIEYDINPELSKQYRLEVSAEYSESQAIEGLLNIVHIDFKYTSILTAAGILGILRQLVIDAGVKPPCALQLSSATQTKKTTLTELCTRPYNRSDMGSGIGPNAVRTDSSLPKISELLEKNKDCVFLLDDLFRTKDKKQKKDMERVVTGILRMYADNSVRRNMQSEYEINSQLIITSEYLLDDISNVGRCFYLIIENDIDLSRLRNAQNEPLILSTAYFYFIKYICSRYNETVAFIKSEFDENRKKADQHIGKYERIYEMGALLTVAFKILCNYAVYKGSIHNSYAEKMVKSFKIQIEKQIDNHCKHVERLSANDQKVNLSRILLYLIDSGEIIVAYEGSPCFMQNGFIYIRISSFAEAIYKVYDIRMSAKAISGYFAERYISEVYRSSKNRANVKKKNGINYLMLDMKALFDDAKCAIDPIERII